MPWAGDSGGLTVGSRGDAFDDAVAEA